QLVDAEEHVDPYTKVRTIEQCFVTIQAPFFYGIELVVPTRGTHHDGDLGSKTQIDIGYCGFGPAEIDGDVCTAQVGRRDALTVIFIHNQLDVVSALLGEAFDKLPHFAVSK